MNLIFCGMPMSGKSTIGKLAADKLHRIFIDTDRLIEALYLKRTETPHTCRQIYQKEGESYFRDLESEVLTSLPLTPAAVISVGGGSLLNPVNLDHLKSIGRLIYLKTPADTIWERMQAEGLPAYLNPEHPKQSFDALYQSRSELFEGVADIVIDTHHLPPKEIVDTLLNTRTSHGQ